MSTDQSKKDTPKLRHIAISVPDLEAEKQRLAALDILPAGEEGSSAGRRTFYLDPSTGGGITYQLIERGWP